MGIEELRLLLGENHFTVYPDKQFHVKCNYCGDRINVAVVGVDAANELMTKHFESRHRKEVNNMVFPAVFEPRKEEPPVYLASNDCKMYYVGTKEQLIEKGFEHFTPLTFSDPERLRRLQFLLGTGCTLVNLQIAHL
jgi:hypothetical protein